MLVEIMESGLRDPILPEPPEGSQGLTMEQLEHLAEGS